MYYNIINYSLNGNNWYATSQERITHAQGGGEEEERVTPIRGNASGENFELC